ATRLKVEAGDNVLIGGFIIKGPANSTKQVLIRGMGPTLGKFGVPGVLADPSLELHYRDSGGVDHTIGSNDNWQEGDVSQVPSAYQPGDAKESVIVATLTPGAYTAILKGAHGETGVGLAEIYDLDKGTVAQLGNIATRGYVQGGDDVMIAGFIVGGSEPAKMLVRALGPTLAQFGVNGALADPTLELHDADGNTISSNDEWRETQEVEILKAQLAPPNTHEPAILATLSPGNYTAIVRGKNNTVGIALVEAYNLQ
ncbi:MAG: hypothetical protein M3Z64_12480, partial [Verrucomicrobiota bacterium]|nr:hypothetical protein [Verrucomicrobiota bacterium]